MRRCSAPFRSRARRSTRRRRQVALTYSEAVEPRFAIVSVTDATGRQEAAGSPRRSPANADTLLVPLKRIGEGWYLVYWRAISVDGHPVRGAFTFAVGPNPGPAPQFPVPSTSESAATPRLVTARWVMFLSVMGAIGLLALRLGIARPVVRRVGGTSLRARHDRLRRRGAGRAGRDPVLRAARDRRLRAALR